MNWWIWGSIIGGAVALTIVAILYVAGLVAQDSEMRIEDHPSFRAPGDKRPLTDEQKQSLKDILEGKDDDD